MKKNVLVVRRAFGLKTQMWMRLRGVRGEGREGEGKLNSKPAFSGDK